MDFLGGIFVTYLLVYIVQVAFGGLIGLFHKENKAVQVTFKQK